MFTDIFHESVQSRRWRDAFSNTKNSLLTSMCSQVSQAMESNRERKEEVVKNMDKRRGWLFKYPATDT